MASISGYWKLIGSLQYRHLPRNQSQPRTGTLSYHAKPCLHLGSVIWLDDTLALRQTVYHDIKEAADAAPYAAIKMSQNQLGTVNRGLRIRDRGLPLAA